jgi:hypothetical protein
MLEFLKADDEIPQRAADLKYVEQLLVNAQGQENQDGSESPAANSESTPATNKFGVMINPIVGPDGRAGRHPNRGRLDAGPESGKPWLPPVASMQTLDQAKPAIPQAMPRPRGRPTTGRWSPTPRPPSAR